VLKLAKYLRDHSPQVMLTTLTGTNLVSIMARGLSRRRFRLVIREAAALNNVKSTVRKWLMRWLYPSADQIVALTEHMKEQMFNELKIPRHRVTVIGNPLDFERIDVLAKDKRELQYIRSLKPYIVAIGRLAEPKDFYTLIRARGKLPPTAPNLVIIGDGPQRTALESIVQELDLKDCVHLLGFRSNPYPWLRAAQGFMLSSRWEGYPNVLLEALHFGLPIVATEYDCSLRALLRSLNSDCYRLVPVGDVDALAEAILKFLEYSKGVRIRGCPGDYTDRLIERYESVLDIPKDKNN
jgi:glycosyltransferase involved in cell wall biosynthesis